jgi:predicted amidohydrolase
MKKVLAAVVQMNSGEDKARNLKVAEGLIRLAVDRGAKFVVLPETFNGCGRLDVLAQEAEPVPGPTLKRMSALAKKWKIHLLAGSILERGPVPGKAYNTSALLDPSGRIVATYRKMHLFEAEIAGHVGVREPDVLVAGRDAAVASTAFGVVGLSICYDLRFPELYRTLAARGGEIICVPSAFTMMTGKDHWEVLLRARAIEDQAYVIAPNQCGAHPGGMTTYGHSMIVDPWGLIIASVSEGEGIAVAELDPAVLAVARKRVPALRSRRKDRFSFECRKSP